MTHVVVSVHATQPIPTRLVGNVTKSKGGGISIEYAEAGQVKKTTKSFLASEVVGSLAGEAGYVIALLNAPITKITGELVEKDGQRYIKTENGTVALNNLPGVSYDVKEVEADSKEARAAERASKVKVRGVRATATKAAPAGRSAKAAGKVAAKPSREERLAARKAEAKAAAGKGEKSSKSAKAVEVPAKKKKRS